MVEWWNGGMVGPSGGGDPSNPIPIPIPIPHSHSHSTVPPFHH
jgi:hypothetical protein